MEYKVRSLMRHGNLDSLRNAFFLGPYLPFSWPFMQNQGSKSYCFLYLYTIFDMMTAELDGGTTGRVLPASQWPQCVVDDVNDFGILIIMWEAHAKVAAAHWYVRYCGGKSCLLHACMEHSRGSEDSRLARARVLCLAVVLCGCPNLLYSVVLARVSLAFRWFTISAIFLFGVFLFVHLFCDFFVVFL